MVARDENESNEKKNVANYAGRHGRCPVKKISPPTNVETNPGEKTMIIQVNQTVYMQNSGNRFYCTR
jgi:hypothetical protein